MQPLLTSAHVPPLLTAARLEDVQAEEAIRLALEHHAQVPFERITVAVRDGAATLTGRVDWPYQRTAAVAAARAVAGVRDVIDQLTVVLG